LRPDNAPVQWPKQVVFVINTPLTYYLYFDCTILYHLIVSNTTGMSQYSLHFQCGNGTWCSSLNLTGVLGKKFPYVWPKTHGAPSQKTSVLEKYIHHLCSTSLAKHVGNSWRVIGVLLI